MNKRTKACNISTKVRKIVHERDGHSCIICGSSYAVQIAHIIPRSRGGLGIPENLVDLCWQCHSNMDQSGNREEMLKRCNDYLESIYPDFKSVVKIYRKGVSF